MLWEMIKRLFGMSDSSMMEKLMKNVLQEAGSKVMSGISLQKLAEQFGSQGLGKIFQSWVNHGPNEPITPDHVKDCLGTGLVAELAKKAGLSFDDLAGKLSKHLPEIIDKMTPGGKLQGQ